MDPEESGGDVIMNQIQRKSPFWSLAGPLLAYLAIQWVVQTAVILVISIPYMADAYASMMQLGMERAVDMQELMEAGLKAMEPAFELVMRYQVEIMGAAAAGTMILTVTLFLKDRKLEKVYGVVRPEKKTVSVYIMIALLGAAGSIAATCLMAMAQLAFYDSSYQQSAEVMYGAGIPVQIAVLGILIPVSEELMFRGILFKRFRERQGFWYSAIWSALLFSFMHSSTTQMVYTSLLGVLLSYLYEKFGSLRAPVLLHILLNTGSVIFTELGVFRWLAGNPMRMAGAVIAGAFICSAMFVLIQKMPGSVRTGQAADDSERPDLFR